MKLMVAYNGSEVSKSALKLARDFALKFKAEIMVMNSSGGGSKETPKVIQKAEENLNFAREFMMEENIPCETHQLARGLTPGEDIVMFAEDSGIDMLFVGIEKKSRTQKIIMGSTAQYVILKAKCPVITVNNE